MYNYYKISRYKAHIEDVNIGYVTGKQTNYELKRLKL